MFLNIGSCLSASNCTPCISVSKSICHFNQSNNWIEASKNFSLDVQLASEFSGSASMFIQKPDISEKFDSSAGSNKNTVFKLAIQLLNEFNMDSLKFNISWK